MSLESANLDHLIAAREADRNFSELVKFLKRDCDLVECIGCKYDKRCGIQDTLAGMEKAKKQIQAELTIAKASGPYRSMNLCDRLEYLIRLLENILPGQAAP